MAAENFKVKKGLEVGTGTTINATGIKVTGIITATQLVGDGSGLTGVVGSGSGVVIKEEGSAVGTAGTINFVGDGVTATLSAGIATVTVNAGALDNVVEDTTPELGGNLNLNSKFITGSGGINVTGVVTATTFVGNGDFVNLDASGITTSALLDVSNLTNGRVAYVGSTSGRLVDSANLTFDGSSLSVSGINVSAGGTTSTFSADIVTRNFKATGVSTFIGATHATSGRFSSLQLIGSPGTIEANGNITGPLLNITGDTGDDGIILLNSAGGQNNDFSRIRQDISDDTFKIENKASGSYESLFEGTGNAGVKLYFAGTQKLETTGTGIAVPNISVSGVGTFSTRIDTNGVSFGTNSTTFAAKFADNARAIFGGATQGDFGIYHDTLNSYLHRIPGGTGDIYMVLGGDNAIIAKTDSSVELYWDDAKKLETDTGGVKITGVATATSFSGSAAGLTNIPSAQLTGALPSLDGSALTGITASGSGIVIQHDGSNVGTAGTINFSTNLDVSPVSAGIVTVTASGGGGVSLSGSTNNTVATVTGANALIGETNLTFDGSTLGIAAGSSDNKIQIDGTNPYIQFREGTTNKAYIQWSGSGYLQLGNEEAGEVLRLDDGESGLIWRVGTNNRTVWTSGNDGASSGLNADLLDGQEGSYYTNASNLGIGTIPNGRFPATLPAVSGANLTALNADNISSGTLASARIEDNAVTFDKLEDVANSRILGRVSSGAGNAEELTAAQVRTLLNVADGANVGITTASSNVALTWDVVNESTSAYRFTGPGQDGSSNNPDIYLVRGNKYRFALNASGHPFQIRVSNGGSAYNDGVTNNGAQTGNVEFYVQNDAPASLVYQCTAHSGMVGNIYITGHQLTNGADNRVVTATSAYGMNGEANLTFDGDNTLAITGPEGGASRIDLICDEGDDAADKVRLVHTSGNEFKIQRTTSHTDSLIITSGGQVLVGGQTNQRSAWFNQSNTFKPSIQVEGSGEPGGQYLSLTANNNASGYGARFLIGRTKGTTAGATTVVSDGDELGGISWFGSDGNEMVESAHILSYVDAGTGSNTVPGSLRFGTTANGAGAPTERLRIDSSGRVQIGSSTLDARNTFNGIGRLNIQNNSADGTVDFTQGIVFTDNASNEGTWTHGGIVCTGSTGYDGNLVFGTDGTGGRNMTSTSITEKMRLTADGCLLVGQSTVPQNSGGPDNTSSGTAAEFVFGHVAVGVEIRSTNGANNQKYLGFKYGGGPTDNGGIRRAGTSNNVEFYNGSDRRIKTNIQDMDNTLSKICQMSLRKFDYKDGTGSGIGVIGQELIDVFPEKVTKTDDGTGDTVPDGVEPWSVGNNYTYQILKAIQELKAENDSLKARIETLEGS